MFSLETTNERNCNARLNFLYRVRDNIGNMIDHFITLGKDTSELESKHDDICDSIAYLCNYRRHHKCLIEGDEGYGLELDQEVVVWDK